MFRKRPLLHKKPDQASSHRGDAIKALKKKRTKRIRRRIAKATLMVKDPDVAFAGEVVDFEPAENQILKGVTTHGRKMKNDPIFRRRFAVA